MSRAISGLVFLMILTPSAGADDPAKRVEGGALEFDFYYETKITDPIPLNSVKKIRGKVPFFLTNASFCAVWCPASISMGYSEYQTGDCWEIVGGGRVEGEVFVTTNFPGGIVCTEKGRFSFNIELRGRYWWKPNDYQCSDETVNFSYTTTFNEDLKSTVRCEPSNLGPMPVQHEVRMFQTGFDRKSETIEFVFFPYMTLEVEETVGPVYRLERWTLHLPTTGHEAFLQGRNELAYDRPLDRPTETRPGRFGPPLADLPILPPPEE